MDTSDPIQGVHRQILRVFHFPICYYVKTLELLGSLGTGTSSWQILTQFQKSVWGNSQKKNSFKKPLKAQATTIRFCTGTL